MCDRLPILTTQCYNCPVFKTANVNRTKLRQGFVLLGKIRKPVTFSSRATKSKHLVLKRKRAYKLVQSKYTLQLVKLVGFYYCRKYV